MRFLKHLAISILFALNAFGGWHDSAPYVAWPATNHLRWVDNVGTYTSESAWTNAGYGEWTNNYTTALIWKYDDGYFKGNFPFYFPDEGYGGSNYWVMNAKDIRLIDCSSALLERHLALGGTSNNFYESILVDTPDFRDWLYRNEVANMATLKTYILANCGSFYYQTNGWTNAIQFNETSLCVRANVPTNFFRYTPARSADSASTIYQRILTNTFVLRQGTNAAHVADNILVDSAGIDFTATGTNGTIVTRYATNTNIQAGKSLGAYGWDGLRRVITNLAVTIKTPTWGIGYKTNYTGGYSTNFSYDSLSSFYSGVIGSPADRAQTISDCVSANPNLPYSHLVGSIPWDTWEWSLSSVLTNPLLSSVTNHASSFSAYGSYSFKQELAASFITSCSQDSPYPLTSTNWSKISDTRKHYRSYTNKLESSASPLCVSSSTGIADRIIIITAITNSAQFIVYSNYVSSSEYSVTTTPVNLILPDIDFGFTSYTVVSFGGDGWSFSRTFGDYDLVSFMTAYGKTIGGAVITSSPSETTNTSMSATAGNAIEIWDFEYK